MHPPVHPSASFLLPMKDEDGSSIQLHRRDHRSDCAYSGDRARDPRQAGVSHGLASGAPCAGEAPLIARAFGLAAIGGAQLIFLFWLAGFLAKQTQIAGEALNPWLAGWLFFGVLSYAVIWLGLLHLEMASVKGEG
jgi:hypothetical protein